MASASGIRLGKVFVEIGADPSKLFGALNRLNKRIGSIGREMTNFGGKMTAAGAALAVPLGLATRQFATFDDAIRATAAVTQATGAQLQAMNDRARELGATTSFTAVQVANLMTELGRAGFKPDEINEMTLSVLDLARATGTDASLSANILAETLRQFSMGASDAARVADVLTLAANSTNNTVEGLGEALSYAGLNAAQAGMSIEDTAALFGALGNVGIKGSNAGTVLRRLVTITGAEAEKLGDIFGILALDAQGNVRPLIDVFADIADATNDLPSGERLKKFNEAFGLLGITGAQALGGAVGDIRALQKSLVDAEGTSNKTAKAMDAGLGGSMRIAMSAIEGTALAVSEALAPQLQKLIEFITSLAGSITAFVKENQGLIVSITQGIAAFAAAGVALTTVGFAMSTLSGAMGLVIAATTTVVASFAAVVTGAGGVLFSLAALIVKYAATAAASVAAAAATQAVWIAANWPILAVIGTLGIFIKETVTSAKTADLMGSAVGGVAESVGRMAKEFGKIKEVGVAAFDEIYTSIQENDLAGALKVAIEGLKAVFTIGANAFLNEVDRWGVNLVNAFDFYISQIPFLRFATDKYEFKVFGSSNSSTADQRADARFASLDDRVARRRDSTRNAMSGFSDLLASRNTAERIGRRMFGDQPQSPGNDGAGEILTNPQLATAAERAAADKAWKQLFANVPKTEGFATRDMMSQIAAASSGAQLESLMARAKTLSGDGYIDSDQLEQIQQAADAAGERIRKEAEIQAGIAEAAQQSEAVGTFSSVGLNGMGFGSSLQQKMADAAAETAKNTAELVKQGKGEVGE